MDVFHFRDKLVQDYADYIKSFIVIKDNRINHHVDKALEEGALWPQPLIQLNPAFSKGESIDALVAKGILHPQCKYIFQRDKEVQGVGKPLILHKHQADAIRIAQKHVNYVLTTGTGSGKSMTYIVPIVDHILKNGSGKGIQAIIVYPMNALANSQHGELAKFIQADPDSEKSLITFKRYTGQETEQQKRGIQNSPPDILLTNYVMLELILTRPEEDRLIDSAMNMRFLVLDELHTYRGRQGADVAILVRRLKNRTNANIQCVGTSATLASSGTFKEQCEEVSKIASQLFGGKVEWEHVIGETLTRTTKNFDKDDREFIDKLKREINNPSYPTPLTSNYFLNTALSSWIESTFGTRFDGRDQRWVRCIPQSISGENGAAVQLHEITNIDRNKCEKAMEQHLLAAYLCEFPEGTRHPFAFRLHQFISKGDTVYASIEAEEERYITLLGQKYVPGKRDTHVLLPLVFCRECGQEYYNVRVHTDLRTGIKTFFPRELNDQDNNEIGDAGFLYISKENPWPSNENEILTRVPDDWLEWHRGKQRIRKNYLKYCPQPILVKTNGCSGDEGILSHIIAVPFQFCLSCGTTYGIRQKSDYSKLSSLGAGGRSSSTTILSLSSIQHLRESGLKSEAQKLLSFTDNRQDASLQAGHFNDFIEISILRSGLYNAVQNAGPSGIKYYDLPHEVFKALSLPFELYSETPNPNRIVRSNINTALREVIGYRLYRDLRRGWRIISPNLEQCGLLRIEYESLKETCEDDSVWKNLHPALVTASSDTKYRICLTLLDFLRRELAIDVESLDLDHQEKLKRQSEQLIPPWSLDENERMYHSSIVYPRSKGKKETQDNVFLSPMGGFGQFLKRNSTLLEWQGEPLKQQDIEIIIKEILAALSNEGLLKEVETPKNSDEVPGYQISASILIWKAGDGSISYHDPIRIPNAPETGGRTNPYFINLYKNIANKFKNLEAREHTAQVKNEQRRIREDRFKDGDLPILYCSPTMELGVDISDLNAVNMRNVPPSPANYAQRSGRAGRSGQPALVFTYCAAGNSHDQYFFKKPQRMVAGQVLPPRLDLTNEDLIRSHIQAIWLAETGISLKTSLKELLDLSDIQNAFPVFPEIAAHFQQKGYQERAKSRAKEVLQSLGSDLDTASWYDEEWLDQVFTQIFRRFDDACSRWRNLYQAALNQQHSQNKIVLDPTRSFEDKQRAERLRNEAEAQLKLLTDSQNVIQSDFYSYRYFASEGFLPGYNFPRLPLSAFIPGRKRNRKNDEYLSRPRFLAISEFGPRAIVYHEGSQYIIDKAILPAGDEGLTTRRIKLCETCGYVHYLIQNEAIDRCVRCHALLGNAMSNLFHLQNVSTRRRERITCDEEERMRMGYEIISGFSFNQAGNVSTRSAQILSKEQKELVSLTYNQSATLCRINVGWRRRKQKENKGYILDLERGTWARKDKIEEGEDALSNRTMKVIPYVEDRRNCMLLEFSEPWELEQIATIQYALKNAILFLYQLEDNELATEPLPDRENRNLILFYESSEGGAGVLRRIVEEPNAFAEIAKEALELCHFDPETGADRHRSEKAKEDCESACYDCLMSYSNQFDHGLLDRYLIRDFLLELTSSTTVSSSTELPRGQQLDFLMKQTESSLEKKWLKFLEDQGCTLPTHAQYEVATCQTKPDFYYQNHHTAIYVDGPPHDYPDRQKRDAEQDDCMLDYGFIVIRFHHEDNWSEIIKKYPSIFGNQGN
ncbi:DEAD/DEAH box helicase [Deltaproteobacteria bacterium TL4]